MSRLLDRNVPPNSDSSAPAASAAGKAARASSTAGNIALNSNGVWTAIDTGIDLGFTGVKAGQWVELGLIGRWSNESVLAGLDFFSMVAGSPVNAWVGGTRGGWQTAALNSPVTLGGSIIKQLVSGDLASGALSVRLFGQTGSAAVKTIIANTDSPLVVWGRVLG